MSTSTPAPSSATTDGATWNAEWPTKPARTATSTTPHLISSRWSRIASRSFSDITSATRSCSAVNEPPKHQHEHREQNDDDRCQVHEEVVERQAGPAGDHDVRRITDQGGGATDV